MHTLSMYLPILDGDKKAYVTWPSLTKKKTIT